MIFCSFSNTVLVIMAVQIQKVATLLIKQCKSSISAIPEIKPLLFTGHRLYRTFQIYFENVTTFSHQSKSLNRNAWQCFS